MINKHIKFKIISTSSNSLIIQWDFKRINAESVRFLQDFKKRLHKLYKEDILYMTPAFDTLLIKFKPDCVDINSKKDEYQKVCDTFLSKDVANENFKTFEIPVCYKDYGIDLNHISNQTKLKVEDIINIHSKTIYTLHFIGFLPGFLYLGPVDKRIQISRQQQPRVKVEKGSVGLAENQTGIYPKSSPGGWQIIGRTPIDIFDAEKDKPSPFQPGDQIKFRPISKSKFETIQKSKNSLKYLKTL